jgi:hypothetical protein
LGLSCGQLRDGLAGDPFMFGAGGNPGRWRVADFLSVSPLVAIRLPMLSRMATPFEIEFLTRALLEVVSRLESVADARAVWVPPELQLQVEFLALLNEAQVSAWPGTFDLGAFRRADPVLLVRWYSARSWSSDEVLDVAEELSARVRLMLRGMTAAGRAVLRSVCGLVIPEDVQSSPVWADVAEALGSGGPIAVPSDYFVRRASDPPLFVDPAGCRPRDDGDDGDVLAGVS